MTACGWIFFAQGVYLFCGVVSWLLDDADTELTPLEAMALFCVVILAWPFFLYLQNRWNKR
jgi:hypothetical protein